MSSPPTLTSGTLVAGRYRIQEPLAGEGSSAIYRAADTRLDRVVALRILPAAEAGGAQQGKAAARLVHPNVARVLDFGTDTELGVEFVVADLGTGGSLAGLLAQRGAPPLPLAIRMVQEAAAGLAAAHRAGIVHGDLHPGVLWLSRDEGRLHVQVLGLGLNPAGSAPPRATARYAAPERLRRARDLTPATDVFSLGAIAYEVFAGFPADWNQLLLAMARGQAVVAPSLLEARPDLPAHVAHAVRRALAADADSRWPDAGELAAHLIADVAAPSADAPAGEAAASTPLSVDAQPSPLETIHLASIADTPLAASADAPMEAVAAQADARSSEPAAKPEPITAAPTAAEPVAAEASEPAPKPSRQPLTAGRRGRPVSLASTDLADTLYIPPAVEPAPAASSAPPAPAAAAPSSAPVDAPAVVAASATSASVPAANPAAADPPITTPIAPIAAAPIAAEPEIRMAPEREEAIASVPDPVVAEAPVAIVAAVSAEAPAVPGDEAPAIPLLPERRKMRGTLAAGPSSGGNRRAMLAASIAVAVIVGGGVVVKMVLVGGGDAQAATPSSSLASAALASAGGARPSAPPAQAPAADSALPTAAVPETAAEPAKDEELTPAEQRRQDEERRRLEEQRRDQQRRQDSLRQVQLAAQQAAAQQAAVQAPPPAAPATQQVAVAPPPRPAETPPAPRLEQAPPVAPPSPPRVNPNRVYGGDELELTPILANGPAFRAAVQRTYPGALRGSGQPGSAVVSFVVLQDGTVDRSSISVVEASHPAFRNAAAAAIANARFSPARVDGQVVRAQVSVRIAWQGEAGR